MLVDHLQKQRQNTRIQKLKKTPGDSRYINQNELDKACFQYDMVYGDFNVLARRTASDKLLHNTAFNIAKNWKYDGYQRGLASMLYTFLIKKLLVVLLKMKIFLIMN